MKYERKYSEANIIMWRDLGVPELIAAKSRKEDGRLWTRKKKWYDRETGYMEKWESALFSAVFQI